MIQLSEAQSYQAMHFHSQTEWLEVWKEKPCYASPAVAILYPHDMSFSIKKLN